MNCGWKSIHFVTENNTKSRAVCERLCFISKKIQLKAENLDGNMVNRVRYTMQKDRWLKLSQQLQ